MTAPDARAPEDLPGPPPRPVLGNLLELREDPLGFFVGAFREYGDTVRFRWGGTPAVAFFHPDQVQEVLQAKARVLGKRSRGYNRLREAIGNGILNADGEEWVVQRRLMQPAFHAASLRKLAPTMEGACRDLVARFEELANTGEVFDLGAEMMHFTFRVVGETLLGTDVVAEVQRVAEAMPVALGHTVARVYSPVALPLWVPTPGNRRFHAAMGTLRAVVQDVIDRRRAAGRESDDLLSVLVHARDEETGAVMSDENLRDQVLTIFLAGHDTTSHALSWTLYLLAGHAAPARRVGAELAAALGDAPPTADRVADLPVLARTLDEAMRLLPPAWLISRAAAEDVELGGVAVAAGTYVFVSPYVTHRHPEFFENPEGFDPDRFLPEPAGARHRFAYFPFGAGPRVCIGKGFALLEARLALASILQRFRPVLAADARIEPLCEITMKPRFGVPVRLRRVDAADARASPEAP